MRAWRHQTGSKQQHGAAKYRQRRHGSAANGGINIGEEIGESISTQHQARRNRRGSCAALQVAIALHRYSFNAAPFGVSGRQCADRGSI